MIQRDEKPGLRFAGMWDFPGGGREGQETPLECIVREVQEELGITLNPASIVWQKEWPAIHSPSLRAHFMVAKLDQRTLEQVRFGNEGQRWRLMPVAEMLRDTDVVPHLQVRLQDYLDAQRP